MALVKWDPWREIEDKCVRYTRAMGWPRTRGQEFIAAGDRSLRVDIPDPDTAGAIKLEIPEVKKRDARVAMDNGVLSIRGERNRKRKNNY
jgi:HSP20 family protein